MGYYAKDGSYVREASDYMTTAEKRREEYSSRRQKEAENQKKFDEWWKLNQSVRESNANRLNDEMNYKHEEAMKVQAELDRTRREEEERKNLKRYGTDFDFRNPKNLGDRVARANYWRIQNGWHTFINHINGKSNKFMELDAQLRKARTEEEKRVIVESMEKLFPTRNSAIKRVENQQRRASR